MAAANAEARPAVALSAVAENVGDDPSTTQTAKLTEQRTDEPSATATWRIPTTSLGPHHGEPPPNRRALALGAAFVPGLVLHGSGNFVLGRHRTAERLLLLEGAGILLLAGSGTILFTTGAARDFVGPVAATTITGVALFSTSFLADLYSVIAPVHEDGWRGFGRASFTPHLEAELGYRYVIDPHFDYDHLVVNELTARLGDVRLTPSLRSAPTGETQRLRTELAFRLWGASAGELGPSGTYFEIETALTHHRWDPSGFRTTTFEVSGQGRWDLLDFDPNLAGSFFDYGLGVGSQLYAYDLPGTTSNSGSILLANFGFGVYFGPQDSGGEARIYYNHRHDDFASGLLQPGLGSGVAGHFGIDGQYFFNHHFGIKAAAEVGSAFLVGASGLFRWRGPDEH